MRGPVLLLLACAGMAAAANVVGPEWYKCDPLTCQAPDCMCPSDSAPGGLTPAETPQFVLVQHSMALEEQAYGIMESVRKGLNNPNGCPIPMTWFAMMYHSNCSTGWAAQGRGDEIAMQTNRYTPVYPFNLKIDPNPRYNNSGPNGKSSLLKEIEMSRAWWNTACKIPLKDMNGFRSPELVHNPPVRQALEKLGFLYDATINEYWAPYSPTSSSKEQVLWPYTMDNGIPQDCNFTGVEVAFCNEQERYPGLWEVPIYQLQNSTGGFLGNADYGMAANVSDFDLLKMLKENFDDRYNGNRAPLTVSLNLKWLNDTANANDLRKFLQYAASKPNTWFITTQDLVHWMQNPRNTKEVGAWLTCTEPGIRNNPVGAPAPAPSLDAAAPAPADAASAPEASPSEIPSSSALTGTGPNAGVATASTSGASALAGASAATLAAVLAALALLL